MNNIQPHTSDEFHAFEVDTKIVNDLIYRQNGTISTAIRELVMNAFDANSEKVEILIWAEGFEVKDTGDGFEDEASIMRNFKRFGTPHVEGDVPYGRFRIGRGQVMAFARTTWHSKNFKMIADVKSGEAGFVFKKDAEHYEGCHVSGEFFTPLQTYELHNAIGDLTKLVRYSPFPVFINQIQVNTQDGIKWDYEDEQIKITFNPKGQYGIHLYSLGILVKELQMYRYGIAADIVTKQALQLNMARNEINENDPLWQHVHKVLRAELRKKQLSSNRMTESERHALIDQFLYDEVSFVDIAKLPLLKDVRGKSSSFDKELRKKRPWSVCEEAQARVGDRISTQGNCFVIPRAELDTWRVKTIQELIDIAQNNMGNNDDGYARHYHRLLNSVDVVSFDKISTSINDQYDLTPLNALTAVERAQRNALQYTANNMCKRLETLHSEPIGKRKVHVGVSHAVAWTDSSTYVAFNRDTLSLFENGTPGITQLVVILLHELTHRDGSVKSNGHDMTFYESFHDSVICTSIKNEVLGNAIVSLRNQYQTELEKANLPFPKWLADRELTATKITLQGKSPTPLLTWFLDLIGLPIIKGRGRIDLQANQRALWEMNELVTKRIDSLIRKHGLTVARMADFNHISDFHERIVAYKEARAPIVRAMLEKEGIFASTLTVELLANFPGRQASRRCPFGGLSALTEDEAFGVKCLHNEYKRNIRIMAGKGFNFSSNFGVDWRDRDVTAESLADGGQEARFAHYKKILEDLVNGITDAAERTEFVARVFNDAMKKSLNRANT